MEIRPWCVVQKDKKEYVDSKESSCDLFDSAADLVCVCVCVSVYVGTLSRYTRQRLAILPDLLLKKS